jgi:hypothetical protein
MNDVRSNFGPQFEPVWADNVRAQAEVKSGFDKMHTTVFIPSTLSISVDPTHKKFQNYFI